jgi:phosphate transport system protein
MLKARHILDVKKKQIETQVNDLATQVKCAIDQAITCLAGSDKALCKAVVENDSLINEKRRLIEQDCVLAIALHQPVAHDLREIVAATRIAEELERTADYAADIAAIVKHIDQADLSEIGLENILKMSSLATRMLDEVTIAFLRRDSGQAKQAASMDDEVDAEQEKVIEQLFAIMQANPSLVPNASRMLWISHNLERCGDRATNIAEQVVFMLEAKVVELD